MKKTFLFVLLSVIITGSLIGCEQQADQNIKDQIKSVSNKDYVGNPQPVVKEEMKLTKEERAEFEKLQEEIMAEKEGN